MYERRFYRKGLSSSFFQEVSYKESDLYVSTDTKIDPRRLRDILKKYYDEVETYGKKNPVFFSSLSPVDPDDQAPSIVQEMIACSQLTKIGPFACVAGAIAAYVGRELLNMASEVIIENGGDIFLKIDQDRKIGVLTTGEPQGSTISLKIKKRDAPFGIASSSSRIGHSLSFGNVDLVTVIACDPLVADGFATAFANRIKGAGDIAGVLETAKAVSETEGVLIALEDKIHLWGDIQLAG